MNRNYPDCKFIKGASCLRQDRAIRSNSSDLPVQILRDFRFYPLRGFVYGSSRLCGKQPHSGAAYSKSGVLKIFFLVFMFLCSGLFGMPRGETPAPSGHTDALGRTVDLGESPPRRMVSLSPGITEILYAIGARDQLVGITDYCDYPPETAEKTRVGGFSGAAVSVETIAALKPDLVLLSGEMHGRIIELLDRIGIKSFAVEPQSFAQVYETIEFLGTITGHREESLAVSGLMKEKIALARQKWQGREAVTVFWLLWDDPLMTAGGPTLISEAISLGGGKNIFDGLSQRWPEVSAEEVLRRMPQWILSADDAPAEIRRPSWASIPAVRQGRTGLIDAGMINRYGPRLADAVLRIAELLHE